MEELNAAPATDPLYERDVVECATRPQTRYMSAMWRIAGRRWPRAKLAPVRVGATSYTLPLILLVYLALATLFALKTPPWQNPDEPAHYNYVAFAATKRRLPVLQIGAYDEAYLQRLKAEKFPSELSIEPVRYEFHQPPLYYLLAAPVYWLSGGNLLALRLFSVALGAGVALLIFLCARTALPDSPHVALGAAAFAAFLPMHIAVMASVNNDALAQLVVAGAILALLRWQRAMAGGGVGCATRHTPTPDVDDRSPVSGHRRLLATGLLIGLGFLTKATTYILLPVALIVVVAGTVWRRGGPVPPAKAQFGQYALLLGPALLLGLPWWIRNSLVYGNWDFLGLAWHDVVVTGQPTAAAWIAENGWDAYWERAWTFTSRSFWGVFGWLAVFMDARIYTALSILSVMAAVGVLSWSWRRLVECATRHTPAYERDGLVECATAPLYERDKGGRRRWVFLLSSPWMALLPLWLGTFAAYGWYNLGFIQHQGRYLFPALPTWSLLFALGWWTVLERRTSIAAAGILLAAAGQVVAPLLLGGMTVSDVGQGPTWRLLTSDGAVDKWALLLYGVAAAGLLLHALLSNKITRLLIGRGGGDVECATRHTPAYERDVVECATRHTLAYERDGVPSTGEAAAGPLRPILYVCLYLALIALDIAIPFLYIAPQLRA